MKNTKSRMKQTPQRLAIMEYLEDNKTHPSAADVYRAVSEKFPTMSFATVYNTLDTLKSVGKVRELSIDPEKKRFDPNMAFHHHLMCIKCKCIQDVYGRFDLRLGDHERGEFDIVGNHVEFYGICPACKAAPDN